ncbi:MULTISPECIES: hypothetical protein [unclassified Lactococcus]|uniref:hypothetical protein n=1 Tax=unclassified Lactococcus TaxID=2643510 RepID=UPI0011CC166D|nr:MULTISPECIES: hypothetical protein [unclassified Lactococcus]MQW23609.1 hypothetical protein [Lactococcus sp. dk101]TXK37703.1 hypothetical protein FVP42_07700 [Lactococcus sp. dk310]TXK49213.1 hypothetical protein FVP43_07990 [Lactococcus sp. dk322]
MDYADFMKSKRIAERWGEAQAAFESSDNSSEVAYYQEILTDFYDYIQFLEAKAFETEQDFESESPLVSFPQAKNQKETVSDLIEIAPVEASANEAAVMTSPKKPALTFADLMKDEQEVVTDEEDPWFGFME